jgi:hypothetical protein
MGTEMKKLWVLILFVSLKVFVIIEIGHLAANIFNNHANISYTLGLFVGIAVQTPIPPKSDGKVLAVMVLIAIGMGTARRLFL